MHPLRQSYATNTGRRCARWLVCLLVAVVEATASLSAKRKDDVVVLVNGDRLVGEIKELSQGELHFKTDYILDQFHIDWTQVRQLESLDAFHVAVSDGRRLTGIITRHDDGRFTVTAAGEPPVTISSSDIINMLPAEASFWAQLTGQINSGFSYTSGDSQSQFSASGSVGFAAERYATTVSGSSSISAHADDDDGSSTQRTSAELANQFPIGRQWFAGALLELLNSDEQDLQLRTTTGGGVGHWLIRTEHTMLAALGGLVYTHEAYRVASDPNQDTEVADNLEGLISVQFVFHRFKTTDIDSKVTLYPSISSPGRYRVSAGPSINIEIVRNLYWTFTLYENYDSHPPVDAKRNDFGVTNALGWKF